LASGFSGERGSAQADIAIILTLPPLLSFPPPLSFFFPSSLFKPSLTLPLPPFYREGKRKRGRRTREGKRRKERVREGLYRGGGRVIRAGFACVDLLSLTRKIGNQNKNK